MLSPMLSQGWSHAGLSWLASLMLVTHSCCLPCSLKGGLMLVSLGLSDAGHSLMLSPMLSQGWSHAGLSWLASLMLVAHSCCLPCSLKGDLMLVSLDWPLSCWSLSGGLSVSCWSLLVSLMLGLLRVVPRLWCSLLMVVS